MKKSIQNDQKKERKPRGSKLKDAVKRTRNAKMKTPADQQPAPVEVEAVDPIWVDDDFKMLATSLFPKMYP